MADTISIILKEYSVLASGESAVDDTRARWELLQLTRITSPPVLVSDLMTAAESPTLVWSPAGQKRKVVSGVNGFIRDFRTALWRTRDWKSSASEPEQNSRRHRALCFMRFIFVDAPHVKTTIENLFELEVFALSHLPNTRPDPAEKAWVDWRRLLEEGFIKNNHPRLGAALVQLRESGGAGFSTTDESVWHMNEELKKPNLRIDAVSQVNSGEDRINFRDLAGPFSELGAYTIPPDPTRLAITDLALLSHPSPKAKALIAAKISDASLSVRFGNLERPSRRRARCLLVICLCDGLIHHQHQVNHLVPEVDFLREVLVHLIPRCIATFASQTFETIIEIRREGALRSNFMRFPNVRSRDGKPLPELAGVASTIRSISTKMHWLLDDAPDTNNPIHMPNGEGIDEKFLVTLGEEPNWKSAFEPTIHASLLTNGTQYRQLYVRSKSISATVQDVASLKALEIANRLVVGFGHMDDERQVRIFGASQWEGTILV